MPQRPPVYWPQPLTDEDRALIAGYLLHHREGTLEALSSLGSVVSGLNAGQFDIMYRYYRSAEAYSRFLLYWVGYPVEKGKMYEVKP